MRNPYHFNFLEEIKGDIVFTSDFHFNHRKLCNSYEDHFDETRDYETVEEMNESQIKAWNDRVTSDTTALFLGDMIMSTPGSLIRSTMEEIWSKMTRPKRFIWVFGNHDHKVVQKASDVFPCEIYDNFEFKHNGVIYVCQHYPFETHNPMGGMSQTIFNELQEAIESVTDPVCLVHGHTHSRVRYSNSELVDYPIQNCVCIDAYPQLADIKVLRVNRGLQIQ